MTCSIPECGKPRFKRDLCSMHYQRWQKYRDPLAMKRRANGEGTTYPTGYRATMIDGVLMRDHIRIAEKALGKPLPPMAVVHHVNEDRADNRNENLVICPNQEYHHLIHKRMRAMNACGNADWLKCSYCKQYDAPENLWVGGKGQGNHHRECVNAYHRKRYQSN